MMWPVFAAEQPSPGGASPLLTFAPLILIFGVMYLILFRPQRKKEQERRRMLEALRKNDHVTTIGGIKGVITSVKEDEIVLRVDDAKDVRLKFSRSAISRVLKSSEESGGQAADFGSE